MYGERSRFYLMDIKDCFCQKQPTISEDKIELLAENMISNDIILSPTMVISHSRIPLGENSMEVVANQNIFFAAKIARKKSITFNAGHIPCIALNMALDANGSSKFDPDYLETKEFQCILKQLEIERSAMCNG